MEDIYGNLDNYNEVHVLEQLKGENKGLKIKLEEYATAMEKLQKDFDTLSSEYKKLEQNYSSLLKTAKAEIERKTQIITNINIEKDSLVLSALQNGNRNVLRTRKFLPDNKNNHKKIDNGAFHKKNVAKAKDMQENENKKCDIEKESVGFEKSSSDGVGDWPIGVSKQDYHTKHKEDRKSFHKNSIDRPRDHKISEISGLDDRSSCHLESTRPTFQGRHTKYYDGDKRRNRDKYDNSQRHKRHYSPDRHGRKPTRDYYDDYNQRPEFTRNKGRESPPLEHFHHNSYKEHRQYEKNHPNGQERYTYCQDRHAGKHKMLREYEEPYGKRQKTEYHSRMKEDVKMHDKDLVKVSELTETFEKLQERYTSCQSPDYISCEIAPEPMKEIMNTAETQLEDPRLTATKYMLSNDKGLAGLCSINSSSVDLIPVDKSKWKVHTVSMPDALIQLPQDVHLIKDLYRDIEQTNLSLESGEIDSRIKNSSDELSIKDKQDEKKDPKNTEKEIIANKNIEERVKISKGEGIHKYKIPKINKCDKEAKTDVKKTTLDTIVDPYKPENKNDKHMVPRKRSKSPLDALVSFTKTNSRSNGKTQTICENNNLQEYERVLSTREIVEGDLELSDETCDNTELQKTLNQNVSEGDLNCYHLKKTTPTKIEGIPTLPSVNDCQSMESDKNVHSKVEANSKDEKFHSPKENLTQDKKTEQHIDIHKKHGSKKKSHKYKESGQCEGYDKKLKAKRDKKEKSKVKVKTKFNDLFGDSNSLITPADLGISAPQVPNQSSLTASYVPIFEDALDATDLDQNTITKIATIPETKDVDPTNTSVCRSSKMNVMESISKNNELSKDSVDLKDHNEKILNETASVNALPKNVNLEHLKSDVVATIIISTGVQPDEINSESRAESLVNAEELLSDNIEQDQIDVTHKEQDLLIKALATSTPHKQAVNPIALEIHPKLSVPVSNANCKSANINNAPITHKPLEPPNEDLPDVRIFVKRRRRLVKTAK